MSETWVYVGGTFDLFHYGHASFLEQCKKHGKVVVSLNTDAFASRYKRRPILSLEERIKSVQSCKWVDLITVNVGNEDSGYTIDKIDNIPIKYIAHGDDWNNVGLMHQLGIDQSWLDQKEIKMLYIPYTKGISTSEIIGRVNGDHHRRGNCSCGLGESCSYPGVAGETNPKA